MTGFCDHCHTEFCGYVVRRTLRLGGEFSKNVTPLPCPLIPADPIWDS